MSTDQPKPEPFKGVSVAELQELATLYERVDPLVEIACNPFTGEARVIRLCRKCRAFHPLPEN